MQSRAYLALIIATLCWGGNVVAGKLALGHVSPMVLTFLRWLFAVTIIVGISVPQLIRDWPVVKKNLPLMFVYGAVGYTSFNVLLYTALKYTSAINAAIVQASIPMMIFLINFALFSMRATWAQLCGFALTLMGVGLLASQGDFRTLLGLKLNTGDALMLLAAISYAIYTITLRWKPPVDWRTLMAFPAIFALLTSVPLLLWEMSSGQVIYPDTRGWIITFYTAIFASLIAQILYIVGVSGIGPNRAGLFINLVPVFGTLMSVAVLGEPLHFYQVGALALALTGIAVAERGRRT